MSARPRPVSQLPKPPISLHPTCVIADTAVLTGAHLITVEANAVLHPRARIVSTRGPVVIGEGCIISEKAVVGPTAGLESELESSRGTGDELPESRAIVLERNVVLLPTAIVEGSCVGEGTVLEAGSKAARNAKLGKYCRIAPLCVVPAGEILEDFTVIFGNNQRRTAKSGLEAIQEASHGKEIEALRKLIPSNLAKWQTTAK